MPSLLSWSYAYRQGDWKPALIQLPVGPFSSHRSSHLSYLTLINPPEMLHCFGENTIWVILFEGSLLKSEIPIVLRRHNGDLFRPWIKSLFWNVPLWRNSSQDIVKYKTIIVVLLWPGNSMVKKYLIYVPLWHSRWMGNIVAQNKIGKSTPKHLFSAPSWYSLTLEKDMDCSTLLQP